MIEIIVPSSGQTVQMRGLTVEEEIQLTTSISLMDGTLYDLYDKVGKTIYQSISSEKPPYPEWIQQISENDIPVFMYGLVRETFDDEIQYSFTCPNKEQNVDFKVDLTNDQQVLSSGKINDSNKSLFELTSADSGQGIIQYRKIPCFEDIMAPLLFVPLKLKDVMSLGGMDTALSNPAVLLNKLPEREVQNLFFSKKCSTIQKVILDNKEIVRPPVSQILKARAFYDQLSFLRNLSQKAFTKLIKLEDNPYQITFFTNINCPLCGEVHEVPIDFFRVVFELLISHSV